LGITGSSFSKGDVFRFADEVKNLIELLNGIVIQSQDKERLNKIIFQKEKIEKMIVFFEPNIYEEYSEKVKILYLQIKKAKEEYNRVVKENCFKEVIEEYKNKYDKSVDDYKNGKLIRDKIKEELNKI
jgi:hydroxymethylpyrimidine pyrophosphatase-like HAD family hydrolase